MRADNNARYLRCPAGHNSANGPVSDPDKAACPACPSYALSAKGRCPCCGARWNLRGGVRTLDERGRLKGTTAQSLRTERDASFAALDEQAKALRSELDAQRDWAERVLS